MIGKKFYYLQTAKVNKFIRSNFDHDEEFLLIFQILIFLFVEYM